MKERENIDRRSFLTGIAATGALVAAGAMVGCSASENSEAAAAGETATAASWRNKPESISDIAKTVDVPRLIQEADDAQMESLECSASL